MFNFVLLLTTFTVLFSPISAIYTPERDDDWTVLKPETFGNGLPTVDYNFGVIVSLLDTNEGGDIEVLGEAPAVESVKAVSCKGESTLSMSLTGGILRDGSNRIGTIVSNRQFQFDGPTPQYGAVYANGWSIDQGNLMLGNSSVFYQCASGEFYNLYDQKIDIQCNPVYLKTVTLMDC